MECTEGMCHRIVTEGAVPDVLVAAQSAIPRVQFEATRCLANLSAIGTLDVTSSLSKRANLCASR